MKILSPLRHHAFLIPFLTLATLATAAAQNIPAIPPSIDPAFWGHPNKPYVLKLTVTSSSSDGSRPPQTRSSEENVSRDAAGRVRTEVFYNSGQPSAVTIRDPNKDTFTVVKVVSKSAFVSSMPRPQPPPPGKGWKVERLPSRIIAGFPADGFRFTRTIPGSDDGQRAEDTLVEEDWLSNELSVVLERKIDSGRTGVSITKVTQFRQVEPDPALFSIPSDYTVQQP